MDDLLSKHDEQPPLWRRPLFIVVVVAIVGLFALGNVLRGGTSRSDAGGGSNQVVSSPSTSNPDPLDASTIDHTAAGCVGYFDGMWLAIPLDDDFSQILANALADCWADPPDEIAEQSDAFDAYCLGRGAGAYASE